MLILTLMISCSAKAQQEAALPLFDSGTALLGDGQFLDALQQFEEAEALGWGSTQLYYNMALVHHRLDNLGQSIRYLEKAQVLSPDDPKVLHSLSVASSHRVDTFSELPDPFWRATHAWVLRTFPIFPAFWTGFLLYLILIGLIIGKYMHYLEGPWFRRARFAAALIGGALILHALTSSAFPPYDERAVVLSNQVSLLEQADSDSDEVLEVHEGLVVTKGNQASEWTFIQIPNGARGWVPSNTLGDI